MNGLCHNIYQYLTVDMIAATKNERWIYCSDNIEDCWKVWIWFFDSDRFKQARANSYISKVKPLLEAQCDFDHAVGNKKPETNLGFNGMNYFIYTSHHFTPHGRCKLNKLISFPMCGFIAQLVEHRTGIAEVTGSNPVEAPDFFRLLLSNCFQSENLLRLSFFTFRLQIVCVKVLNCIGLRKIICKASL